MNSSKEWLSAAAMDIASIEVLNQQIHLTTVTAFHAQQAIEKSLKAVLEFRN